MTLSLPHPMLPAQRFPLAALLLGLALLMSRSAGAAEPPLPDLSIPITQIFRDLLQASPAEQERILASRPAASRMVLQRKLDEYRALPVQERELRLRMLDLRAYLLQLIPQSPERRDQLLAQIAAGDRSVLEQRLRTWDMVPSAVKEDKLKHGLLLSYLARPEVTPPMPPNRTPPLPNSATQIQAAVENWRGLPSDRRSEIYQQFLGMCTNGAPLPDPGLEHLSPSEREKAAATLAQLKQLPPQERERCLRGFRQFVALPRPERERFLLNTARWQTMSPAERNAWSSLVRQLPPLPPRPGLSQPQGGALIPVRPLPLATTQ